MKFNPKLGGLTSAAILAAGLCATWPAEAGSERLLPIRGVVRPIQEATFSTDLFARISVLDIHEGDRIQAGQRLVEFDCAGHRAERKAAVAEHRAQQLDYENKLVLKIHNAVGQHEINVALALTQKVEAEIERLDARISQCVIKAPFEGRVAELSVRKYEMPAAGNPIFRIIDDTELEIDLIVPSDWLGWLDKGTRFSFAVDETGRQYDCDVIRVGAAVDPVSHTIEVRAKFTSQPNGVFAGMSGFAKFTPPEG